MSQTQTSERTALWAASTTVPLGLVVVLGLLLMLYGAGAALLGLLLAGLTFYGTVAGANLYDLTRGRDEA